VNVFNPSDDTDKFENTAWTLNGRIGALKAVYTGSYLDRSLNQTADYTNYARGHYADYYQCVTAKSSPTGQAYCLSPSSTWREQLQNTHLTHEIRLSTPDDWRLRAIGGAFYEQLNVYDQTDWMYRTLPGCTATNNLGCLTNIAPPPGSTANNPNVRNDNTSFFDDVRRGYTQTALFGSVDFEILPKTLTLTAGTRYYDYKNTERGSDVSAFGCYQAGAAPCASEGAANIDAEHLKSTASGFSSRVNLSWKIDSDILVYGTWSQGYRPGAFNRTSSLGKLGGEYNTPISYPSDKLINKEIGWKTEWADHSVQLNGAVYQEDWSNAQTAVFDPGVLGNLTFNANGPNYRVRGLEQALVWRVTHGLTFQGSAAWNSSSQTNTPYLLVNANCSATSTPACGTPILVGGAPVNIYGNAGSPLAMSPPLMFNGRLRYEWQAGEYQAFWQIGGTHQAHETSVNANTPSIAPGGNAGSVAAAYDIPGFSTYDASIGFAKDAWNVQFFGQNITDTLGKVFISNALAIETQTVIRPRVLGIKVGYKF